MGMLPQLIDRLPRASLEGAAFVLAVALACRFLPRLRATERAALWWLAGAKLLLGLVPVTALAVAILPPAPAALEAVPRAAVAPRSEPARSRAGTPRPTAPDPGPDRDPDWTRPVGILWAAGVLLSLAGTVPGALRARRWRRTGTPFPDPAVRAAARSAATGAGLRAVPAVLAVPGLPGPLVAGLVRPAILLPADSAAGMSDAEIHMALAHEMAHVARRDLALGLVPALARRVFFFHPLAWIVEREYAIARESACDEQAVARTGADAHAYGRLLLRLATVRPVSTAASFSPRSMLRRRLEMIETALVGSPIGRKAGWAVLAAAVALLVPVRLVAADDPPAAPAPVPASAGRCLGEAGGADAAYVVFDGERRVACGDARDASAAARVRKDGEDLIWFRVGKDAWVVRDPSTVAEVKALFEPIDETGSRRADLAAAEAARREVEMGRRHVELAEEQAEAAKRDAELAERNSSTESRSAATDAARMAELQAHMEALSRQMEELGRQIEVLGRNQRETGARQERLAKEMLARTAAAQERLGSLLDQARKNGTATRVP